LKTLKGLKDERRAADERGRTAREGDDGAPPGNDHPENVVRTNNDPGADETRFGRQMTTQRRCDEASRTACRDDVDGRRRIAQDFARKELERRTTGDPARAIRGVERLRTRSHDHGDQEVCDPVHELIRNYTDRREPGLHELRPARDG
jgi:hypothetical protein